MLSIVKYFEMFKNYTDVGNNIVNDRKIHLNCLESLMYPVTLSFR